MDIDLPGMDGVRATGEILRRAPRTRVLVLSAHCRVQDVRDAMNAGASGYVLKADEPEALMEALQHVTRGLPYLPRLVARHLSALGETKAVGGVLDVLSDRERRIFRLAADCRARPEIAHELCLSRKTVDAYLRSIRRKLGLRDRAELVRFAIGLALVQPVRWRGAHPLAGNVAGARGVGDDLVSNLN
jgi:DNA-binding NarL/FixJ family response regulator